MATGARFTSAAGEVSARLRGPHGFATFQPAEPHVLRLLQRIDSKLSGLGCRLVQFVAASPEDSTSAVAATYAAVSADRTRRAVLLLDGPCGGSAPGLVETVLAGRPLADALTARTTRLSTARLLGDGDTPPLLAEPALWQTLRESFAEVVFDSGAAAISPTALLAAARMDAVVVVVQATRTRRDSLTRLMTDLATINAPVLGLVLTNRTDPIPRFLRDWF